MCLKQAKRMAQLDAPLLITGETGTGKELMAKASHDASMRREHPFIPINCAALPDSVAEEELFGFVVSMTATWLSVACLKKPRVEQSF